MSAEFDATEFVDGDFQAAPKGAVASSTAALGGIPKRAPTREEVDTRVGEAQRKLADLKRAQEELERERAGLEETRRRQIEYQTGRAEAIRSLTRAVGLLTEAEFASRREAEQMAKALIDLRENLARVEATSDQHWTQENFNAELTKALTAIENARMEWNSARLRFPVLGDQTEQAAGPGGVDAAGGNVFSGRGFGELCKLGLALTWPVALVLLALGIILLATRH